MWTGNKNNPVPNYTDTTQINPISANVVNPALDVRRDQDPRKNTTITLLDIDTAVLEYLQNVINPTVVDAGQNVKVPILYGNPELRNGRIICKVYKEIDMIWMLHFLNNKT